MENKNRSNDKKASNQSPDYNYFPEQALRTGYMGSYAGRFHREYLLDHSETQPHFDAHAQPHHHPMLQPHDLQEAIQREMEKQHIREEMIIAEIARRRVLEAEVRRELMMERELSLRRAEDVFPFGPSSGIGYDSTSRFPVFGMRSEGRSLEERVAMPHKENEKKQSARHENGEIETLPFQRRITETKISEVKSVTNMGKEKGKVVLLANPHEYIPTEKRKAATSSVVDDGELPSAAVSRKKTKQDWSCALCQVNATSEQALKDHVQGKKHKSKEAALRTQGAGKNYNIGLFPKKTAMAVTVVATKTLGSEGVKSTILPMHLCKKGEMSLEESNMPVLHENREKDNLKNNQLEIQEMQKDGNSKKKIYKFWCDMCQVGTFCGTVMNDHKKGKKHMKRLQEFDQNGAELYSLKKAIVQVNDAEWVAGNGKNTTMENIVGEAVDIVSLDDHMNVDIANSEDHKTMEAAKLVGVAANDAEWTEYKEATDAVEPGDNKADIVVKPEFREAMVAAKPEDNKADDAVEPEFSVNAAKPVHNKLSNEVEPQDDELSWFLS